MANLKITLTKSLIGRLEKQIATAHALGLKKINDVTIQPNNPQTQGKIAKISHLISVEDAE
jgi:large subunit ribosomal protein L30